MNYWEQHVDETGLYCVNLWGSKPGENDDCWTGVEFETLEEAEACYANWETEFSESAKRSTVFIQLIGPEGEETKRVAPDLNPPDDSDWQKEFATQAGMAFGCAGYNDAMGY